MKPFERLSVRKILRLNEVFYLSVFIVITGISGLYLYNTQTDKVREHIVRARDNVRDLLDVQAQFIRKDLLLLEKYLEEFKPGRAQANQNYFVKMTAATLGEHRVQYNAYVAFEKEYAERYFGKDAMVLTIHRDLARQGDPTYLEPRLFLTEIFTDPNYQSDQSEVWYHVAKVSEKVEFTDIYYDESYMKKWLVTAGLGIYENHHYKGMVGVDVLVEELGASLEKIKLGKTGGVLLVDTRSNRVLNRLSGKPGDFVKVNERYEVTPFGAERETQWKALLSGVSGVTSFAGDNGKSYIVSAARIDNMPWAIVSFQEYREAYGPLFIKIMVLCIAGGLGLCVLAVVSKRLERAIEFPIRALTKSLVENIQSARRDETMKVNVATGGYKEIHRLSRLVTRLVRVVNISTKKHLNNVEEQRSKAMYAARMASIGQMAANVSHEINSPLSAIVLAAELVERELQKCDVCRESSIKKIGTIKTVADRIGKTVHGLLAISRDGKSESLRDHEVRDLVQSALEICQERLENEGIRMDLEIPQGILVRCRGIQISQVLLNLINNARDAILAHPEKWIKLRCLVSAQAVVISVTDSGMGIPKEIAHKIMQPFFTTKDVHKGTGLGLSISKDIIEEHGGTFFYDVHSENTSFVISLPK